MQKLFSVNSLSANSYKQPYVSLKFFNFTVHEINLNNIGCPQGSCLGPLLFIMYTADMQGLFSEDIGIMFADDTCVVIEIKTSDPQGEIEKKLKKYWLWFSANKLSMNISKTAFMTNDFRVEKVTLDNKPVVKITKQNPYTYLGIKCEPSLDWKSHANVVLNKMKNGLYALSKAKFLTDSFTKQMIYESLVNSHFRYSADIWFPGLPKRLQQQFNTLQNKCLRIVTGRPRKSHTDILYRDTSLLKLADQTNLCLLVRLKNHIDLKKQLPTSISSKFIISDTLTRQLKIIRTKSRSKTLLRICRTINSKMKDLLEPISVLLFKSNETNRIISNYKSSCDGTQKCYVCQK